MKKSIIRLSLILATVLVAFYGCRKEEEFEEETLYGAWHADDGFIYTFNMDHSGSCLDEKGKGLEFTWSMSGSELTIDYKQNGQISKPGREIWTIKKLSSSEMKAYESVYPDDIVTFKK
jgi:hypothetical protein